MTTITVSFESSSRESETTASFRYGMRETTADERVMHDIPDHKGYAVITPEGEVHGWVADIDQAIDVARERFKDRFGREPNRISSNLGDCCAV